MDSCDSRIQPPLKNRKTELVGLFLEDKISHLPDGIICHILSLIPTKYGIRTRVLSKRWENLWALASKIDIDSNISTGSIMFPYKEELGRLEELRVTLTHSVDTLFFLRDSIPIQSFKLHCQGDVLPPPLRPGSWLCAIVMCNTLVVLKLSGRFILNVPHYVRLSNLKTLLLDSVIYLDDALLPKLLMGCPLLEELDIIIHDWGPMGILNVGLSSLQKLKIFTKRDANSAYQIERLNPYTIVIGSQNLEFIHLTGWSDDIFLYNLPNIVEAQLDIVTRPYRNSKVIMLLRKMVNVTRLILSPSTLKSICLFPELSLPTFFNLVVLELYYGNRVPIKLIDLLHSSPKLETLYLPQGFRAFGDFSNSDSDSDIDLEFRENDPERVPECLHCSLKIVKIKYFCGEKVELNIVHYLLRNAMVLKKMTILCCHKRSSVKFIQLKAKLTNYARLSTDCQLDVLNNSLKHQSLADDDDDDDANCNDVDDDDDDDDDVDVDADVDIGDDDDYYNDNDVEDDDDVDDDV